MFVQNDWLLRQIELMTTTMLLFLTGKRPEQMEQLEYQKENELSLHLKGFLSRGEICQGENILFEAIENGEKGAYEAAIDFYKNLNILTDEELKKGDFSRQEILDGLKEVARSYGMEKEILELMK